MRGPAWSAFALGLAFEVVSCTAARLRLTAWLHLHNAKLRHRHRVVVSTGSSWALCARVGTRCGETAALGSPQNE